jgi:5-methylcytosine-specific restriction protein B
VHETARFLSYYRSLRGYAANDETWFTQAFDAVIIQKLLPKLHGSRAKLEGLLWALAWACGMEPVARDSKDFDTQLAEASQALDELQYGPETVWSQLNEKNPGDPAAAARYPLSYDKIMRMWRRLIRDQFVAFAEA